MKPSFGDFLRPQRQPYGSPTSRRNPADLKTEIAPYGIDLPSGARSGYTQAGEPATSLVKMEVNIPQKTQQLSGIPFPFPSFPTDNKSYLRSPPKKRGRTLRQRQLLTIEDQMFFTVLGQSQQRTRHTTKNRTPEKVEVRRLATSSKSSKLKSFPMRPRTANTSSKNSLSRYGGGWKKLARPKTASSFAYTKTRLKNNKKAYKATSPNKSRSTSVTRLKRRNQRKKVTYRQQQHENGPETSEIITAINAGRASNSCIKATFVSLQLGNNPHMYNKSEHIYQKGVSTNAALGARARGAVKIRGQNELILKRGWRKPKKNASYMRAIQNTNPFGYHREFTPLKKEDYDDVLDMYSIYRKRPQKNISIVNVSVRVPSEYCSRDSETSLGPQESDVQVESILSPHTKRKPSDTLEIIPHTQQQQFEERVRENRVLLATEFVTKIIALVLTNIYENR